MRGRVHLVEFYKLFPFILSNAVAVLEPSYFDSVSGENLGCHGVWRMGREYGVARGDESSKGRLKWNLARGPVSHGANDPRFECAESG